MRKLALIISACTLAAFASAARAQQIDLAVGGSSLFSSRPISASQAYPPPAEKGGLYPSVSAEVVFKNRLGLSAELAYRDKQGFYNGYQRFRPVLYDVNAVFAPRLSPKMRADFMAGAGGESLVFYNQFASCNFASCPTNVSSTHLLAHLGGGVRYYFWRHFFVRPEAHYYFVINNSQFHSDSVLRLGASIGYTIGP